jgi:hypothetical protein
VDFRVTLILADYAVFDHRCGKVTVVGGFLDRVHRGNSIVILIRVEVPWSLTEQQHTGKVALLTEDLKPVVAPDGHPIELSRQFVVHKPEGDGVKPGTPLSAFDIVPVLPLNLPSGRYVWQLTINDHQVNGGEVFFDFV